jgi:hypothetical protein
VKGDFRLESAGWKRAGGERGIRTQPFKIYNLATRLKHWLNNIANHSASSGIKPQEK